MTRQIVLNAFDMNCVTHIVAGTWRHPESQAARYKDLEYWLDLAKLLERGLFDGLFIADVLGVYDVYGGGPEAALRSGAQVPVNDPLLVVPAMAAVTEHLGFGITASTSLRASVLVRAADVHARPPHRRDASAGTSSPATSRARPATTA